MPWQNFCRRAGQCRATSSGAPGGTRRPVHWRNSSAWYWISGRLKQAASNARQGFHESGSRIEAPSKFLSSMAARISMSPTTRGAGRPRAPLRLRRRLGRRCPRGRILKALLAKLLGPLAPLGDSSRHGVPFPARYALKLGVTSFDLRSRPRRPNKRPRRSQSMP